MNSKKLLATLTAYPKNVCLGIFLVSFIFYLLFSHLLLITDPVESNYALTAKEMVLASDWLAPRIYGNVWFDKPVFFYWLTAISFKVFGFSEWAARVAPVFFAAMGVVLMYWFVTKIANQAAAILAVLVMGTSLEYMVLAKLIITDMVFFVFNSAALGFFYLGYVKMDGTKRWYFVTYISMALAVLTKGPIGALLPGLVMLLFITVQRNWAELKEMFIPAGVLLFAVVALPWYLAMYAVHGAEFLHTFFGVHNYLRATVSEHPKDNVSYYYIVVFILSMMPWSALAIRSLIKGCKDLRPPSSPLMVFTLIWVAAYFGFYSLMATKYLTYTFPIVFPVSILTAMYLDQLLIEGKTTEIFYWAGVPLILLMFGYVFIANRYLAGWGLAVTVISLLLILLYGWWQARGRDAKYVFGLLCLCQLMSYIVLSMFVLPAMAESRSGKGLAQTIVDSGGERIGLYQFYSTSAVFYSGNVAAKLEPSGALPSRQSGVLGWSSKYTMPTQRLADFMAQSQQENSLIVVPDKQRVLFLKEAANFNPQLWKSVEGFSCYHVHN